ncbi:hypothetical protein BLNAU_4903 [Blattamonas nauphoetae]|uniref:Uncharacterized protein n=1 Tax=Blattamonas nauphoetae TaxID=2049346 RepID=A0ABQ9Y8I4_9EUKA|nr:hypothetical protein BLNAU_4903 [Blattamonas nauphoetae]
MGNSITPTLLQTSSLLNTVVTLFRSPSIPLQTTEWTPQLGWHDRNWNGQPSRSSAGLRGELQRSSADPTQHTSTNQHNSVDTHWRRRSNHEQRDDPILIAMNDESVSLNSPSKASMNLSTNSSSTAKHEEEPFLRFDLNSELSFEDKSTLYNSLVALVKAGYTFDNTLQDRAVVFLKNLEPKWDESNLAANLVSNLVPSSDDSPTGFVDTVVAAALSFVRNTLLYSSLSVRCRLIDSDLISKVNFGLTSAADKSNRREMIFQKVVIPSSQFVMFLISNRHILNGDLLESFMYLLSILLEVGPYHRPTLDFVLASPIAMTFSSFFSLVERDVCHWNIRHGFGMYVKLRSSV